jgi:hypothetical protein
MRIPSFVPVLLCLALSGGLGLLMATGDYNLQGTIIALPTISLIAYLVLKKFSSTDSWNYLHRWFIGGLVLKCVFGIVNLYISLNLYGDIDVARYDLVGRSIAQNIWRLQFDQVVPFLKWGTDSINIFTGLVYSVIGPSIIGATILYALLGFLGSFLFYRAFQTAFPEGDRRLYTIFVLCYPSILFWANGIGKDTLVFLFMGIFAYGAAHLLTGRLSGITALVIGLLGVTWVRPYMAAILAPIFILVFLIRVAGRHSTNRAASITILLVMIAAIWLLIPQLMSFMQIQNLSIRGILDYLNLRQGYTATGGSSFQSLDISNPINIPVIGFTVLFRPLPLEAHNLQTLLQSIEGLGLLVIVIWRVKSIGNALKNLLSNAYIQFIVLYIVVFMIAYSSVQNFGILARQRTMMLPFFFMLMACAPAVAKPSSAAMKSSPEKNA